MKLLKLFLFLLLFCGAVGIKGQDADARGCGTCCPGSDKTPETVETEKAD